MHLAAHGAALRPSHHHQSRCVRCHAGRIEDRRNRPRHHARGNQDEDGSETRGLGAKRLGDMMRTELKLALAAALVVAIAAPAPANDEAGKLGPQLTWDAARDGSPRSYMLNGIKLTFTSAKDADKNIIPVLTLNAPGVAPVAVKGLSGFDHAIASFGVAKIDPKNSGLQVI